MLTCIIVFIVGFALGWFVHEKTLLVRAWNKFTDKIDTYR